MADTTYDDSDYLSPEAIKYKRALARDEFANSQQYKGGRGWGALAMALSGALSGYEENQADQSEKGRRAIGQRMMQDYNDAGRPTPSPLVSALGGGSTSPPMPSGTAPTAGLPAGPGSMPQTGMPPSQPGTQSAPSAPGGPTAPALSGPRPGFANTPGAMDTDRERRQEAILARASTMEGPVGDWARQQMTFVNQKKLAFGLEHEKAQIAKQLDLEKANEAQKQQINEMVALGILTEEQGQRALGRMGGAQPQSGAAPSPAPPQAGAITPAPTGMPGVVVDNSQPPQGQGRPQPLTPGGQMPPGTRPGPLTGQDNMTASMPPLSENAQRAQKMIEYGMMKGNRAMVQAGNDLLNADPTQEARKKQAEKMGVNDANLAERRRAGTQVEATFDRFNDVVGEMRKENPKAFDNAIGRINSAPYIGAPLQTARAAVMGLPVINLTNNYTQGADYHNRMDHLIDGLTTSFMSAASNSGMQMSDKRMAKFEETMGAMRRASNAKEFDRIMTDARGIIHDVFSLNDGKPSAAHVETGALPAPVAAPVAGAAPPPAPPQAQAAPRANFMALPANERRSAVAEFVADKNPAKAENFKQAFGQEGLDTVLSIIQEQRAALAKPASMPSPLSNFDPTGRFIGQR